MEKKNNKQKKFFMIIITLVLLIGTIGFSSAGTISDLLARLPATVFEGNVDMGGNNITNASTINTGQGANELYAMDQDVLTSSNVKYAQANITGTTYTNDLITKGPYVDVRAFGAVGDGVTNDGPSFASAINTGYVVFIPKGTYNLSDYTFNITSSVVGSGQKNSILISEITTGDFLTVNSANKVRIQDLQIYNENSVDAVAIKLKGTNTLTSNILIDGWDIGYYFLEHSAFTNKADNTIIQNSRIGFLLGGNLNEISNSWVYPLNQTNSACYLFGVSASSEGDGNTLLNTNCEIIGNSVQATGYKFISQASNNFVKGWAEYLLYGAIFDSTTKNNVIYLNGHLPTGTWIEDNGTGNVLNYQDTFQFRVEDDYKLNSTFLEESSDNFIAYASNFNNDSYIEGYVIDSSFNDNHVRRNADLFDSKGGFNGDGAFNFNGSVNGLNLGNDERFSPFYNANVTSFEVWVKFNEDETTGEGGVKRQYIFSKRISENYEFDLHRTNTAGGNLIKFQEIDSSGSATNDITLLSNYNFDTWYHIVIVLNGTHMLGYLNGDFVASDTINLLNITGTANFEIGSYLNGTIDNPIIYTKVLYPNEIKNKYISKKESSNPFQHKFSELLMLKPVGSAPSNPSEGWVYIDSDSHEFCFYNSTAWVGLVAGGTCS